MNELRIGELTSIDEKAWTCFTNQMGDRFYVYYGSEQRPPYNCIRADYGGRPINRDHGFQFWWQVLEYVENL